MKLNEMKVVAAEMYKAKQPTMFWGAPGIGKSAGIWQFTQEAGIGFIDLRLSQMDPVDLRGFPYKNGNGLMHWAPSSALPSVELHGKCGILFLDEINAAPPSVSAAAYQLIHDRKVGEYVLPDGWVVFAAGNREGDRGVTFRMPAPLANRFIHVDVEVDLDVWCVWAIEAELDPLIVAFLRFKPGLLHAFKAEHYASGKMAFPTPRSWEFANRIVTVGSSQRMELLCGAVGEGAATEFEAFIRVWSKMPNPDTILLSPDAIDCPKDVATCYALAGALAYRAAPANMENICKFAGKMSPEYQVVLMRDACTRDKTVANTKAFNAWAVKNKSVMIV